jgi:hypothetical protein
MSPWKVFSEHHYKTRDLLWLLFRVHKLCLAKYLYFHKTLSEWQPIAFYPDKSNIVRLPMVEAFQHIETSRILTITALQKITDKDMFINWVEVTTGRHFDA